MKKVQNPPPSKTILYKTLMTSVTSTVLQRVYTLYKCQGSLLWVSNFQAFKRCDFQSAKNPSLPHVHSPWHWAGTKGYTFHAILCVCLILPNAQVVGLNPPKIDEARASLHHPTNLWDGSVDPTNLCGWQRP